MYTRCLPKIGFSLQAVYPNEEASVDRFTQLSGHGIIHINSHGWAWPTKWNIKEVYVLTREILNKTTSDKYKSDIKNGNLIIPRVKFPGYERENV